MGHAFDAVVADIQPCSNMAFEDGSDIITASIGGNIGWSEVPWSVAVSRIVDVSPSLSLTLNSLNQDHA